MSPITMILGMLCALVASTSGAPPAPAQAPGPSQQHGPQQCPAGLADKLEEAYETCMSQNEKGSGKSKRSVFARKVRRTAEKAAAGGEGHGDDELSPEMIHCAVEAAKKQIPEIEKIVKDCEGSMAAAVSSDSGKADPKSEKKQEGSGGPVMMVHCVVDKLKALCPDLEGLE